MTHDVLLFSNKGGYSLGLNTRPPVTFAESNVHDELKPFSRNTLHKSHNTPLLPPKNLNRHCVRLLLKMSQEKSQTMVTQTFWGEIEVHYKIVQVVN